MTIYKYPVGLDDKVISMPDEAVLLMAAVQGDVITLWALVDPEKPKVDHPIRFVGTGWDVRPSTYATLSYFDSGALGPFVWHLFVSRSLLSGRERLGWK